jgi:hypothetical protein
VVDVRIRRQLLVLEQSNSGQQERQTHLHDRLENLKITNTLIKKLMEIWWTPKDSYMCSEYVNTLKATWNSWDPFIKTFL